MIMANASSAGNRTGAYTGGIPPNVTLHAWPIPKFDANLKQTNETNYLIDKSSESAKNFSHSLHNLNATGYVAIDDDLTDTGLTDVQTFILAGVATVIPLLFIVITVLGVRFLWRRYRAKKEDGYEGVLQKEESSEPLGKLQTYSLPQELKTSESQFTVTPGEDFTSTPSTQLPTSKSNGSVITMTLKNNHLIVETEETVNTPEGTKVESKGTITKFVTSKVPDFHLNNCPQDVGGFSKEPSETQLLDSEGNTNGASSSTNHGALVHCAPEETEDELEKGSSSNTGLSQSDLSVSSTESQNPSYRYGNQTGYDCGYYGYPEYSGYATSSSNHFDLRQTGPKSHKIYARGTSITEGIDFYQNDSQAGGQSLKDILMSDIQAREKRVHDKKVLEQNACENGDSSLPQNKTEGLLPKDSTSSQVAMAPELQLTILKSEAAQKEEKNKCIPNNGINCKGNEES